MLDNFNAKTVNLSYRYILKNRHLEQMKDLGKDSKKTLIEKFAWATGEFYKNVFRSIPEDIPTAHTQIIHIGVPVVSAAHMNLPYLEIQVFQMFSWVTWGKIMRAMHGNHR